MDNKKFDLNQIKKSILNDLKNLSLAKKDRDFLLKLIELFDILTEKEENKFLNKLQSLIKENENNCDLELEARIYSLKTQLDQKKYIEIRHFPHFSIYFQMGKIDFYPKKIPLKWDELVNELKKIEFETGSVYVYKSMSKKELISTTSFKPKDIEKKVLDILMSNIFINTRITLHLKKEKL